MSEGDRWDVERVAGRPFRSSLPVPVIDAMQGGVLRMTYRNIPCMKNPFDMALYLLLMQRLKPRTVVEIGTFAGGSALWFADALSAQRIEGARVVSVDIDPQVAFQDARITLLTGSAHALGKVLGPDLLSTLAHPWLVIEDSSHFYEDSLAVLEFFRPTLHSGDYVVVEDGCVAQLSEPIYRPYENGPNRAVAAFLAAHPGEFEIDAKLCDFFGYNVTGNPNGWLRRR